MAIKRTKTKILATLGPATDSEEKILQLVDAGVNGFRLNFSHGDKEYFNNLSYFGFGRLSILVVVLYFFNTYLKSFNETFLMFIAASISTFLFSFLFLFKSKSQFVLDIKSFI